MSETAETTAHDRISPVVRDFETYLVERSIVARSVLDTTIRSGSRPTSALALSKLLIDRRVLPPPKVNAAREAFVASQTERVRQLVDLGIADGVFSSDPARLALHDFPARALEISPVEWLERRELAERERLDSMSATLDQLRRLSTYQGSDTTSSARVVLDRLVNAKVSGPVAIVIATVAFALGAAVFRGGTDGAIELVSTPLRLASPGVRIVVPSPDRFILEYTQPAWLMGTWVCRSNDGRTRSELHLQGNGHTTSGVGMSSWGTANVAPNLLLIGDLTPGAMARPAHYQIRLAGDHTIELRELTSRGPDEVAWRTCVHVSMDRRAEVGEAP